MGPAARLVELTRLLEDPAMLEVARRSAAALASLPPDDLRQLRDAPGEGSGTPYSELFDMCWERWVEPDSPESINAGLDGDQAELAFCMSYQGVVIDHLIRLRMERSDVWWDRARALVAAHPATAFRPS